jgi:hypothetical protein
MTSAELTTLIDRLQKPTGVIHPPKAEDPVALP